jgi:hypothetical protein
MRTDFNGDGRDDILWRHSNGTVTNWLASDGGEFVENYGELSVLVPSTMWIEATGDFDGNGGDDILWRKGASTLTVWRADTFNGGFLIDGSPSWQVPDPYSWTISGIGDFNGDGRDDILWRHVNGTLTDWLGTASGGFIENYGELSLVVPHGWNVVGTGDFNGDGRDDILWRHTDGTLTDWLGTASGGFIENYGVLSREVPDEWLVKGTGDFNDDGRDDILWRHLDGTLTDWLGTKSGGFIENYGELSVQVPNDWQVAATGDFDGFGGDDILWRNGDGRLTDWLGTAGGFVNNDSIALYDVPVGWLVMPNQIFSPWDY